LSPYRSAPPVIIQPKAPPVSLWRRWMASRRGVFLKVAIRQERARCTRDYPCASWKSLQKLATDIATPHDGLNLRPMFSAAQCQREHETRALAWARRDMDGLIAYYMKVCAKDPPPDPNTLSVAPAPLQVTVRGGVHFMDAVTNVIRLTQASGPLPIPLAYPNDVIQK